jgi:hypothetical protein
MLVINSVFSQVFKSVIPDAIWNPSSIFYGGEQGVWYDPSDLTTLFQDTAGATPVTAVGQTVGLMLDKSQGPIGPELVSNGTFVDNTTTGWYRGFASTNGTFTASGGFATYTVGASDSSSPRMVTAIPNLVIGKIYRVFFTEGTATGTGDRAVEWTSNSTGTGGTSLNRVNVANWNGENKSFLVAATATTMYLAFSLPSTSSGSTGSIGNVSVKSAYGNHATQATSTQRPTYQVDGTGRPYLLFDGVDDGMVTGTITPAINKVQVFAGVRKLSDAAIGFIVELSAAVSSNNGSFWLGGPLGAGLGNYDFASKGTTNQRDSVYTYAAPITSVLTGIGDISAPLSNLRVNGSDPAANTGNQGTGNYLAYPLYIGRRGGTTNPFNGRIYSMIVRFGSNLDTDQITSAEGWVNSKTGAY